MDLHHSFQCLKDMKNILDKHQVVFWLDSGSLLGCVRDKKIIEWDNDIDIATFSNSIVNKIDQVSKELCELGYDVYVSDAKLTIKKGKTHISLYLYNTKTICGTKYITRNKISKKDFVASVLHYVFLESFRTSCIDYICKITPKKKLLLVAKKIVRILPAKNQLFRLLVSFGKKRNHLVFYRVDIEYSYVAEFKKINFYDIQFNIPIKSEDYLKTMYGENWYIPDRDWDCTWSFYKLMKEQNLKLDLMSHLEKVVNILNQNKIHFWMYGGALLGYVRDGDLIPWDKDIDLFVWEKDYHKLLSLRSEFKKHGFRQMVKEKSMDLMYGSTSVEFQYYVLKDNKALIEDRLVTKNKFGNMVYFGLLCKASRYGMKRTVTFLKWLFLVTDSCYVVTQMVPSHFYLNLKDIDFFGLKLRVPSETEKYFEYTFGKDWRTPKKDFKRPVEYYNYGGLSNSKYRKYYKNVPGWETKCIQ